MTIISAKLIKFSIPHGGGKTIKTFELEYPRFIHAEVMTHRVFSRNASSSRAIPVERMIKNILANTAMPIHWGKNQQGMQAEEETNTPVQLQPEWYGAVPVFQARTLSREDAWLNARDNAIRSAFAFHRAGYHKQVVNRLIEPFMHIRVILTATEFDNFYLLRDHKDAEPHIRMLAQEMKKAEVGAQPETLHTGDWHLPYVPLEEVENLGNDMACRVSAARCARVSYLNHDGTQPNVAKDIVLFNQLAHEENPDEPLHASPMEHPATPYSQWNHALDDQRNFRDWVPFRSAYEASIGKLVYAE